MAAAREKAGLNYIEKDHTGRTTARFPWAPEYIAYSQPKKEDEVKLGHDLRYQLVENIENVRKSIY